MDLRHRRGRNGDTGVPEDPSGTHESLGDSGSEREVVGDPSSRCHTGTATGVLDGTRRVPTLLSGPDQGRTLFGEKRIRSDNWVYTRGVGIDWECEECGRTEVTEGRVIDTRVYIYFEGEE